MPTPSLPLGLKAGMGLKQMALGDEGNLGTTGPGVHHTVCTQAADWPAGVSSLGSSSGDRVGGTPLLPLGAVSDKVCPEPRRAEKRPQA